MVLIQELVDVGYASIIKTSTSRTRGDDVSMMGMRYAPLSNDAIRGWTE